MRMQKVAAPLILLTVLALKCPDDPPRPNPNPNPNPNPTPQPQPTTPQPVATGGRETVRVNVNGEPTSLTVELTDNRTDRADVVFRVYDPNDGVSSDVLERWVRWSQIIVNKDPLIPAAQQLPRFDVGVSAGEAAAAPANDVGRRMREARAREHDPFQAHGLARNTYFADNPNITGNPPRVWDSYIILWEITATGGQWSARAAKVWRWEFRAGPPISSRITPVNPTDATFRQAMTGAQGEFAGAGGTPAFREGDRYPLPVPNPQH